MPDTKLLTLHGAIGCADRRIDPVEIREGLAARLLRVNDRFAPLLRDPFHLHDDHTLTGRPIRPGDLPRLLQALDLEPEPLYVSWGIGWQPRSVRPDAGPCGAALARGCTEGRWVTVGGLGEPRDRIVNTLFQLLQVLRQGWTPRQRAAVATRWRHPTQKAAAQELDVDKSLMSRRLKAAHYVDWREGMRTLAHLLETWLGEDAERS